MPDRVAVVGNCQCRGVAYALSKLVPSLETKPFPIATIETPDECEVAADELETFDVVLTQKIRRPDLGRMSPSELGVKAPKVLFYPQIIFGGFHPDFTQLRKLGQSATHNRHSLIVAAAFALDIPVDRVLPLFNAFIFARLGYFDEYTNAKAYVLGRAAEIDFDLTSDFEEWLKPGAFMYAPNHPAIRVMASIALKAAKKIGLTVVDVSSNDMDDELERGEILPIYGPIAKRIGIAENPTIKLKERNGSRKIFDMKEYIFRTYELYKSAPTTAFEDDEIQKVASVLRDEVKKAAPKRATAVV